MRKLVSDINCCDLYELSKIHNPAGNITVVQPTVHLPFRLKESITCMMCLADQSVEVMHIRICTS